MPEHQISLPEQVYDRLLAVAETQGISPTKWIVSNLPDHNSSQPAPSLYKDVSDLIGSLAKHLLRNSTHN
jgi:hypothetical protein